MKKRVISFLIMIVVALALIGCDKYYVKIEGPETVEQGETVKFEVDTNYQDPVAEWSVSDDTIASIDEEGNLTGLAEGEVTVIVKVEKAGKAEKKIEVVAPSLPAYTPAQIKPLLAALKEAYDTSEHGHIKIEIDDDLALELIYNYDGEVIETMMCKLSGSENAHVYIKDDFAYMSIGEAKSKSEMTDTEHYTIINSYGFALFVEKATGFYDEDPFFDALSAPEKAGDTLIYELDLSAYNGVAFDASAKDAIKLLVTFAEGEIVKVSAEITAGDEVNKVVVNYLGTDAKTIDFPADLDTYPLE